MFEGKRCIGVQYTHFGETKEAKSSKEVIVSGGAINSPQILMVSGIGPAEALNQLNINVIADLPGVGQNLQDHLFVPVSYKLKQPLPASDQVTRETMKQWEDTRKGPLSSLSAACAFLYVNPKSIAPDLQFHFFGSLMRHHGMVPAELDCFSFYPTLIMPESRGEVKLHSADPLRKPIITMNYLEKESDINTLVAGIKIARKIASQSAFDTYRKEEILPGKEVQSDDELRYYIRSEAQNVYHASGTCKMGTDPMAVVTPDLKVRGIEGLRVIDASVMPIITNGNTNAPAIVIGTKGADLILADYDE